MPYRKHLTLKQCWFAVGRPSTTLAQPQTIIDTASRLRWVGRHIRVSLCQYNWLRLSLFAWLPRKSQDRSSTTSPVNTRHSASVGLMLGQRRRRWTNNKTTLAQFLVLAASLIPALALVDWISRQWLGGRGDSQDWLIVVLADWLRAPEFPQLGVSGEPDTDPLMRWCTLLPVWSKKGSWIHSRYPLKAKGRGFGNSFCYFLFRNLNSDNYYNLFKSSPRIIIKYIILSNLSNFSLRRGLF